MVFVKKYKYLDGKTIYITVNYKILEKTLNGNKVEITLVAFKFGISDFVFTKDIAYIKDEKDIEKHIEIVLKNYNLIKEVNVYDKESNY